MTAGTSQPIQALAYANKVRLARAADKKAIAARTAPSGRNLAAWILEDPPLHWQNAEILELLTSIDKIGVHTAKRLVRGAGIDRHSGAHTPIKMLTGRERAALARALTVVTRD